MHTYLDAILDSDSCERVELGDLMFDVAWAAAAAAATRSARITIWSRRSSSHVVVVAKRFPRQRDSQRLSEEAQFPQETCPMQDPNINNKTNAAGYQISHLYSILFHTSTKQTHTPWPVFKGRKTTRELQSSPSQTLVFTYPDLKQKPQHIIKNIFLELSSYRVSLSFVSMSLYISSSSPLGPLPTLPSFITLLSPAVRFVCFLWFG